MSIKIDLKIFGLVLILALGGQSHIYLMIFAFAIIHELAHLFCGLLLGLKPENIKLMPVGLSVTFKRINVSWIKGMLVCLAGPLVNLIIASSFMICDRNTQGTIDIIYTNLLIGIFNLIPIIPLDGGRLIKMILKRFCLLENAYRYLFIISNVTMVILTIIASGFTIYLKNVFIPITIVYLWTIMFAENKKIKMESRIIPLLNMKANIDKNTIKYI